MGYRFYTLTDRDEIVVEQNRELGDDDAALAFAGRLLGDEYAAEAWTEDRLVGRVGGPFLIDLAKRDPNPGKPT